MRVIIAGGGTYGHIAPGLALYNELNKGDNEVIYICSPKDLRYKKLIELGDKVKTIPVTAFKRFDLPAKLKFGFNFIRGYLVSRRIIRKFKPDVVIGVGGYVSGAPLMVVRNKKKIKKILLEQNTLPGAVNRFFSKYADLTILTFESSKKWMKGKAETIGNPVLLEKNQDNEEKGRASFNIDKKDFVLAVMGGSLGAKIINDTMVDVVKELKNVKIIWSTGPDHADKIKEATKEFKNIQVYPFIDNMEQLLSISDLMVSRAGATSIAEICYMGVPAIMIPYKYSSGNHQVLNGKFVVEGGGGEMIEEDYLTPAILKERIQFYIDNKKELNKKKENILNLFDKDVTKLIINRIKKEI